MAADNFRLSTNQNIINRYSHSQLIQIDMKTTNVGIENPNPLVRTWTKIWLHIYYLDSWFDSTPVIYKNGEFDVTPEIPSDCTFEHYLVKYVTGLSLDLFNVWIEWSAVQ